MLFRQIEYFQAIIETGNFYQAAEKCNVSQSAISQQIKKLEQELGVKLLDRHNRTFSLTPAGEHFYRKSLILVSDIEQIKRETKRIADNDHATLRIGYYKGYHGNELSEAVAEFSSKYPTVEVSIIVGSHEELYKAYINEADSELEAIFQKLWQLSKRPSTFHLQIYTLELLHRLLNMEIRPPKTCGFYTETQVEIAKRAAQILSDDLRQHIPVRQIAERFSVSETSLKNYFRGVYGQNVSIWLRGIRMNEAARLLSDTKRLIAEISEQVGYSNQGKFAAVFKKHFGLSPLEYRRSSKLKNI